MGDYRRGQPLYYASVPAPAPGPPGAYLPAMSAPYAAHPATAWAPVPSTANGRLHAGPPGPAPHSTPYADTYRGVGGDGDRPQSAGGRYAGGRDSRSGGGGGYGREQSAGAGYGVRRESLDGSREQNGPYGDGRGDSRGGGAGGYERPHPQQSRESTGTGYAAAPWRDSRGAGVGGGTGGYGREQNAGAAGGGYGTERYEPYAATSRPYAAVPHHTSGLLRAPSSLSDDGPSRGARHRGGGGGGGGRGADGGGPGGKRRFAEDAPRPAAAAAAAAAPRAPARSSDPYLQYYGSRAQNGGGGGGGGELAAWPPPLATAPAPSQPARAVPSRALEPARAGPAAGRHAAPSSSSAARSSDPAGGQPPTPLSQLVGRTSSHGAVYTRMSENIINMVRQLDPSPSDLAHRSRVLQVISDAVRHAFPECPTAQVRPFGSFVSGLGTKDSDMDLVIVGLQEPPRDAGFYDSRQRPAIARLLDRAAASMYRFPELRGQIRKHIVIRSARIPLARFTLASGLVVDLSIAGEHGAQAAAYLAQQAAAWPALRPLVLVIKSFLKSHNLNDVSTGGLSSYGLSYMVLAHLQEEAKANSDTKDLGHMLLRFFRRYGGGAEYRPHVSAIAVGLGGIVSRRDAVNRGADFFKNEDRIATVDPLTGRDCTEGCYLTEQVLQGLATADRHLSAVVLKHQDRGMSALGKVDLLANLCSAGPDSHEDEDRGGVGLGKRRQW